MSKPMTNAGRDLVGLYAETPWITNAATGKGTMLERVLAIEAEATAAAEQRLAGLNALIDEWADDDAPTWVEQVPYLVRTEVVSRLRALSADTPPPASPRQGEPVEVERLARALGAWWAGIEADAKRMGGDLRGVTFDRPNAAAAIIARHYAALSEPAEAGEP